MKNYSSYSASSTTMETTMVASAAVGVGLIFLANKLFIHYANSSTTVKETKKKVILITGASSGIGKATALKLLSAGHVVYGAARRIENMKDIQEAGGHLIGMDICGHPDEIHAAVQRVLKEQKRIDVLINNAACLVYGPIETVTMEDARHQFEVNLFGLANITKAVIPTMREQQQSGRIINISSAAGKIYVPFGSWYCASKHALEGWSDCCRLDLERFGIQVVIVEPGAIGETEMPEASIVDLLERTKGTVYEPIANAYAKISTEYLKMSSPVAVAADTISTAVNVQNPKRRYVCGAFIRPLLFIRKWLGDAVLDAINLGPLK